jgi:hypothetical protein
MSRHLATDPLSNRLSDKTCKSFESANVRARTHNAISLVTNEYCIRISPGMFLKSATMMTSMIVQRVTVFLLPFLLNT